MKRLIGLFALAVLVGAMVAPAFADVDVTATITKDKDIYIKEWVFKLKVPIAIVVLFQREDGAAEASALANVTNEWNRVDQTKLPDAGVNLDAKLENSLSGNSGIIQVNQDVGNMVNQGNIVAAAVTSEKSWTDAQAAVDQKNRWNESGLEGRFNFRDPDREATIKDSLNHNSGIAQVNQNTGNMNNQTNAVALAVGLGADVALSEAALGQVNAWNTVYDVATVKYDFIKGSVNSNTGIVSVNQSSGNMNNQGTAISVAVTTSSASLR